MRRWKPRLDWEHLKNWVPGAVGIALVILLVVVAANSRTETNSGPAEMPSSQSAQVATNGQKGLTAPPSQPAAPQSSSVADKAAKVPAPPTPPPAATTSEAAKPAPMHDHPMMKAEAVAAPAPVQGSAKPDKEPQKADAASPQGDAVAGRQVFKKCQACHSLEPDKTIVGPSLAGAPPRPPRPPRPPSAFSAAGGKGPCGTTIWTADAVTVPLVEGVHASTSNFTFSRTGATIAPVALSFSQPARPKSHGSR